MPLVFEGFVDGFKADGEGAWKLFVYGPSNWRDAASEVSKLYKQQLHFTVLTAYEKNILDQHLADQKKGK